MNSPSFDDYRAICETKAQYCRAVDGKDWQAWGDLFTDDIVLDMIGCGSEVYEGRDTVVARISAGIATGTTAHQVHAPEITMIDQNTAEVIWAMQDRVIWSPERAVQVGTTGLVGYGHYFEQYRRGEDGKWRIAHCKITRLHVDYGPAPA